MVKQKISLLWGDSGAGKSETIEQIKVIGAAYITDLKTIYDDMGVLSLGDKRKSEDFRN